MMIKTFLPAIFTGILCSLSIIPHFANLIWIALVPLLLVVSREKRVESSEWRKFSLGSGFPFLLSTFYSLLSTSPYKVNGGFHSALLGYLSGTILFAAISFGIIPDSPVGFLFYTFIASLFFALFMLIWGRIKQSATNELLLLFSPPLLWTSLEYIFLNLLSIPFTISLVLYQNPQFLQLASYIGIYGVSFLVLQVNSGLAMCCRFLFEKLTEMLN